MVVVWNPKIEGHVENENGVKQLWLSDLCLTASPPDLSDRCFADFSIRNGGPKAIAIGAQGTRLAVMRDGKEEFVGARRLTRRSPEDVLAQSFLVDVGSEVQVCAGFWLIQPLSEAILCIQAKRILAPQISFQIRFLMARDGGLYE